MKTSEKLDALAAALAKAQGDIKGAIKDSVNPHFRSDYADLASVWDACREPLSKNGLSVIQMPDMTDDGRIILRTMLLHTSDQFVEGFLPINPVKADPQGIGSTITYMRRYALAAAVGVAPKDDDDGERGSGRNPPPNQDSQRQGQPTVRTMTPRDPPPPAKPATAGKVPAGYWANKSYTVTTYKTAAELAEKVGILADEAPDLTALSKVDVDNAKNVELISDAGLRDRVRERIKLRHEALTLAGTVAAG